MAKIVSYQAGMSNGFYIIGDNGAIAVDTGCIIGKDIVYKTLQDAGLKPEDIKLIIITHGHVDHFFNTQALADVTGAKVLCHEKAARFIREGILPDEDIEGRTKMGTEMLERQNAEGGSPCGDAPKGPVDIEIGDEGCDLNQWGIDGKCVYTPGHSRGDISVLIGDEAIVGDLFAAPAFTEYSGLSYFRYKGAPYEEVEQSVQKLLDMGIKKFWSGHGNPQNAEFVKKALEEEKAGHEMYHTAEELMPKE